MFRKMKQACRDSRIATTTDGQGQVVAASTLLSTLRALRLPLPPNNPKPQTAHAMTNTKLPYKVADISLAEWGRKYASILSVQPLTRSTGKLSWPRMKCRA